MYKIKHVICLLSIMLIVTVLSSSFCLKIFPKVNQCNIHETSELTILFLQVSPVLSLIEVEILQHIDSKLSVLDIVQQLILNETVKTFNIIVMNILLCDKVLIDSTLNLLYNLVKENVFIKFHNL